MSEFYQAQPGRVFVAALDEGEDILTSVEELLRREGIENAVFWAGIGMLSRCHTHYASEALKAEVPVVLEGRDMMLCGVSGFMEEKGLERVIHLHGVISDGESTRTVHIHEGCTVLKQFRMVIQEIRRSGTEG